MKRQVTILLTIISLIAIDYKGFGQTQNITKDDLGEPLDFYYMDEWIEFELTDTIEVILLQHFPAPVSCGVLASASITYGLKNNKDTIRIKDLCNTTDNYNIGEKIKIAPSTKPSFDVLAPGPDIDSKTRKVIPNNWDLTVLRTTWGELLKEH